MNPDGTAQRTRVASGEALEGATAFYALVPHQARNRRAIVDALVASARVHVVLLSALATVGPAALVHEAERRLREVTSLCALRAPYAPPGGPNAWNAWSQDAAIQIIVTPRGRYLVPGEREMAWQTGAAQRASETHFALGVARPASELLAIAARADWPAQICDRGGFFEVVELWMEGAYLVELLDPTFAEAYRSSMTMARWKAAFDG